MRSSPSDFCCWSDGLELIVLPPPGPDGQLRRLQINTEDIFVRHVPEHTSALEASAQWSHYINVLDLTWLLRNVCPDVEMLPKRAMGRHSKFELEKKTSGDGLSTVLISTQNIANSPTAMKFRHRDTSEFNSNVHDVCLVIRHTHYAVSRLHKR